MDILHFEGTKLDVTLPSTRKITIRETNAADDEILSNMFEVQQATNIYNFLAAIIVMDHTLGRKPLASDVMNYHVNDQWYLMLVQRIMNRGKELTFDYKCPKPGCKDKTSTNLTEDLSLFDGDLSNPAYIPRDTQIMRYPNELQTLIEMQTSSGRKYSYEIMTGLHDKKRLEINERQQNKNTMLTLRNLKLFRNNEWQTVTSFAFMASKEASEIRAHVHKHDPEFTPIVTGECQHCGQPFMMSLWTMPDFFWPGETV